jgi:hypothetical protein
MAMMRLRKVWVRYLALSPWLQGFVALAPLSVVAGVLFTWLLPFPAWSVPWIAIFAVLSLVNAEIGAYVKNVAQARRDLAADAETMRGAIERLERGDR